MFFQIADNAIYLFIENYVCSYLVTKYNEQCIDVDDIGYRRIHASHQKYQNTMMLIFHCLKLFRIHLRVSYGYWLKALIKPSKL